MNERFNKKKVVEKEGREDAGYVSEDYGSDSWLQDFDVDLAVQIYQHKKWMERNPYFNKGSVEKQRGGETGGSVSKKKDSKRQFWEKYRRDKSAKKRRLAFQTPPPTNKKDDVGKKVAVAVVGEKNNKELKDYENIVVEI